MDINFVWKILFAILALAFVTFGAGSLFLNFANQGMGTDTFEALSRFTAFAFFVFLFFGQTIALFFLVWIVIWAVSRAAPYIWMQRHDIDAPQVPKLFSVVTACAVVALFFSTAVRSIFDGLFALSVYLFGVLPQTVLQEIDRIVTCVTRETRDPQIIDGVATLQGAPIQNCIGELVREDGSLSSQALRSIGGGALDSGAQIPQIILAVVVFAAVLRIVDGQVRTATRVAKFWTAYSGIAAVAMYLSLSATLSVALLLETKDPNSKLTVEALVADINTAMPGSPAYDFSSLNGTQALDITNDTTAIAVQVNGLQVNAINAKEQIANMIGKIDTEFASIRDQARSRYTIVEHERFSSREQALFFQDLLLWSQKSFSAYLNRINQCNTAFRSQLHAFRLGGAVHASILAESAAARSEALDDQIELFQSVAAEANADYKICIGDPPSVPQPAQRQLGSSLGPIGQATGWLLHSQSLPLTLVVGLVGYGLLGALISRFVLARDTEFRVDDPVEFAVVSLAGFVAALVVFVSAFGGMSVLAREATEPNPYAVFALCLGGAVFSSTVWTNLRERLGAAVRQTDEAVARDAEREQLESEIKGKEG